MTAADRDRVLKIVDLEIGEWVVTNHGDKFGGGPRLPVGLLCSLRSRIVATLGRGGSQMTAVDRDFVLAVMDREIHEWRERRDTNGLPVHPVSEVEALTSLRDRIAAIPLEEEEPI